MEGVIYKHEANGEYTDIYAQIERYTPYAWQTHMLRVLPNIGR